jgi:hypothetical protein
VTIGFGTIGTANVGNNTGTTLALAMPASIAAGDMLIAARVGWTSAITASNETGWTASGDLAGGTGSSADGHTSRARADRKEAAGGEGTTTFDWGGTVSGHCGVVARWTKDGAATWDTVETATGTDDAHGTNRSVTASSNMSLQPGDRVIAIVAVDTDTSLASVASIAFSASGITFGTAARRTTHGAGTTAGLDGNVEIFDANVDSGSGTVAVTFSFNTSTSQCGPVVFIKLRENNPNATVTPARISTAATIPTPAAGLLLNVGLVVTGTAGSPAPNAQDNAIEALIEAKGHTVTYLSSADSLPNSGYHVLVITESGSSSSAAITSIPSCTLPVMLQESTPNTMRFCSSAATNALSGTQWDITTAGNSHVLTSALADPFTARNASSSQFGFPTSEAPAGVEMLAVNNGATTSCVFAVAESGATLTSGTAPARRCYWGPGVGASSVATWTSALNTLFQDTVLWLGQAAAQPATATPARINATTSIPTPVFPDASVSPARINAVASIPTPSFPGILPGSIDGIEPESHAYVPVIMDTNLNLYRISESFLAEDNQPKANKSTDGGSTWAEQDAANRPGTDTGSVGDLESGWTIWDDNDQILRFVWQRSFVAYSAFRTSDASLSPDTWVANTRENVAAVTGSPQYASITKPTDQSYEWIFYNNSTTKPSYKQRNSAGNYGSQLDVDSAGQHPAAMLAANGTDTYIVYRKTNDLVFKKLTSGGTLDSSSTRIDTNGLISGTPIAFAAPQTHGVGGNQYMGVLFCNSSTAPRFVLVTNGTAGSEEVVDTDGVLQNPGDTTNDASVMSLAVDKSNGTFYAVWVDTTTGDVRMRSRPHGGSWSSETTLYAASGSEEVQWVYATVLDRGAGNKKLAYTYDVGPHLDDEGDIQYNEFDISSNPNATVQPSRINATTTVQSPTVQTSSTVSPARVLAAAAIMAATLGAGATATPARIDAPATVQSPSITTSATVTPARINGATTVFAPTVIAQGNATATPARIDGAATIPSPTLTAPTTVTPARINGVATVQSPTLTAPTTVTPARISTAATVQSPTITASATVHPARIDGVATVFAPNVQTSGNANVQPARINGVATVQSPSIQTSQTVSPPRIEGVAQVFGPTIRTGAGPVPARIAAVATIFAPTVQAQGNATVTPARINGVASVSAPTVVAQDNETVTPARIAATASVFSPTVRTGATPTPSRIQSTTTFFAPAHIGDASSASPFTPDPGATLDENAAGATLDENTVGATLDDNIVGATLTDNGAGATLDENTVGAVLDDNLSGASLDDNKAGATWEVRR